MIECIFTIDYEIYGNGTGSLGELVHGPTERLRRVFRDQGDSFVAFIEVAELEKIEAAGTDRDIDSVEQQIRALYQEGVEIALHIHPQWANAWFEGGRWNLDYAEYNICALPEQRVERIVDSGLSYLRHVLGDSGFTPVSFRAGNWLFQPTQPAAAVLARRGLRMDSSVFKGGRQGCHGLDYRGALRNGYYWRFERSVVEPEAGGSLIEVPIFTEMVSPLRLFTRKRAALGNAFGGAVEGSGRKLKRVRDFLRLRYPRKFDFCRMTLEELTSVVARVVREDQATPEVYKPIVAIGHTKDLTDVETVDGFLSFLKAAGIRVTTFEGAYSKLAGAEPAVEVVRH